MAAVEQYARAAVEQRSRRYLREWGAAEAVLAVLLASVLFAPPLVGGKAWPPALALLLGVAAWKVARARRLDVDVRFLLVYLAVYVAAAVHGGALSGSDLARYFLRPVAAVAVAVLIVTARQRRYALWLVVLLVSVEIPVTAAQAIRNVVDFGRAATPAADSVTGTLGSSQAGVVTLVATAAAMLVVGAWVAGVLRTMPALVAVSALVAVAAFSATKAAIAFVVAAAVAIAVVVGVGRARPPARMLLGLLGAAAVAVPLLYGATRAIYPDAFVGAFSSQTLDVLGGAPAEGIHPPAKRAHRGGQTPPTGRTAAPHGVQLLPGRLAQLRLAARISVEDGPVVALLGRGPGSSALDPRYQVAQEVPLPQRTGSTWLGRVLTETGWLGLAAFLALLGWLGLLGRRLWRHAPPRTADRALGAALPGLAAVTAIGGAYTTILDVRAYSVVFWLLVGIAMSADRDREPAPAVSRGRA